VPQKVAFNFVDLVSGIGGFHAVLGGMGGRCVLASDIDENAKNVYQLNWGIEPRGDLREFATPTRVSAPPVDIKISVLTAGFPCQPFSKSGKQKGMTEDRGTLFDHIMYLVEKRKPSVVLLENVRNLAGPRHRHEFDYVIQKLRTAGYRVSSQPAVFSPHRIAPEFGGRPQIRERLFITATYCPEQKYVEPQSISLLPGTEMLDIQSWNILEYLDSKTSKDQLLELSDEEVRWLDAWESFQSKIRKSSKVRLPGFPMWADEWVTQKSHAAIRRRLDEVPDWKKNFLRNNWSFYESNSLFIDKWKKQFQIDEFPASRRKFEWQAQDADSIWNCTVHLRPSGIRVKRLTYLPALVAMNQTSIIGPSRRRISPIEAARLQGLPEGFDFGDQPLGHTYKQLGNGVNVGVVWQVLRAHVHRDKGILEKLDPALVRAVKNAPKSPDKLSLGVKND
jgi:DNA (cytosine-5)-methyltransferase 1